MVAFSPLSVFSLINLHVNMCCISQEIYSFAITCAFFELKHEMLWHMVSDPAPGPGNEVVESLSWRFLEEIKPTVSYHEFHVLHYFQWIELSTTHDTDNEHKAKRSMATLRKGGWAWHKGHLPVEIMYNTEMLRRSDGTFDTLPIDMTLN